MVVSILLTVSKGPTRKVLTISGIDIDDKPRYVQTSDGHNSTPLKLDKQLFLVICFIRRDASNIVRQVYHIH